MILCKHCAFVPHSLPRLLRESTFILKIYYELLIYGINGNEKREDKMILKKVIEWGNRIIFREKEYKLWAFLRSDLKDP